MMLYIVIKNEFDEWTDELVSTIVAIYDDKEEAEAYLDVRNTMPTHGPWFKIEMHPLIKRYND